jgi:chromosome segregation and condensation protein ScpB
MDTVDVIKTLHESLDNLENSIRTAKAVVCKQDPVAADVLKRILNYEEVITKQRGLVNKLIVMLETGKADEAIHLIKIINGLSSMIFEDANDLVKLFVADDNQELDNVVNERVYN